jgi:hypothetical protein
MKDKTAVIWLSLSMQILSGNLGIWKWFQLQDEKFKTVFPMYPMTRWPLLGYSIQKFSHEMDLLNKIVIFKKLSTEVEVSSSHILAYNHNTQ